MGAQRYNQGRCGLERYRLRTDPCHRLEEFRRQMLRGAGADGAEIKLAWIAPGESEHVGERGKPGIRVDQQHQIESCQRGYLHKVAEYVVRQGLEKLSLI